MSADHFGGTLTQTDDDPLEVIMLALRTADGLNLTDLGHRYGTKTVQKVLESLEYYISKD